MNLPPGVTRLTVPCPRRPDVPMWIADLSASITAVPSSQDLSAGSADAALRTRISRQVLAGWLQAPVESVRLDADERGAPLLFVDGAPGPFVSFASSGGLLAIAASDVPLGVDIEARAIRQTATEVAALLHPAEQAAIAQAGPAEQAAVFTQLWVRKEALVKAYGTGLLRDLAADDVTTASGAGASMCLCDVAVPASVLPHEAEGPFHAALCLRG
ncbi:4'-phosphopantetheinyl transferase superfamily protein [Brevibacterium sp. p3-SID960]|uniref:4'-phosphopantetheinyl transferase family protein n=1 Tax=Brevibacterium sp. p3-SID960 TaxID=2916063 RepID=UPI0021A3BB1F|nr:4'-phosphopantetheinyl transferase superfamily protein [Brevibacterium sp. p3-SID960]MCT1691816.1 4'-phosphopantetheinyl transferase superfamily protein [Brevibacterium sp. p3-SID960]